MTGSCPAGLRGTRFVTALSCTLAAFLGSAQAQPPTRNLPANVVKSANGATEVTPVPMIVTDQTYNCCNDGSPTPRYEMGFGETIKESLCGDASAEGKWRPLTLGTFFSEGWREPWAGGPAGQCGLTPRHGWLGAFEGVFYRLWLVNGTYQNNVNNAAGGNAYGSNFTTFLPFSRRFELFFNAPYIASNGTDDPTRGYASNFGDLQVAGSFLLSESAAFTQLFTFGATLPTGEFETGGGITTINPRYSFWCNPAGAWVVRGGTGVNIPMNDASGQTTLNGAMAVGHYFRPHDVPFGDLVFYINSTVNVPLEGNGPTTLGVGPGTRFQITGNWYFLNYLEVQVAGDKPFDYQVQAAIVKAW